MTNKEINKQDVASLVQLCKVGIDVDITGIIWQESLINLGIEHGVGAWCYYRIKNSKQENIVPENMLQPWKRMYLQTSLLNQQKFKVYCIVQRLFKEAGIPLLALKGFVLAFTVYPDEGVRPMGDIDVLVPEGDAMRGLDILLAAGAKQCYEPRSFLHEQVHAHVRAVKFYGVIVEIHQRLYALGSPLNLKTDFFKTTRSFTKSGQEIKLLEAVSMGYHLTTHAAYNDIIGGLRLGWLVDIALLFEENKEAKSFLNDVLSCNPKSKKEIRNILNMAALLRSPVDAAIIQNKQQLIDLIYAAVLKKNKEKRHRVLNLQEIWHTPGIQKKIKLFYKEFFPDESYMREKYKDTKGSVLKLYARRILGC